MLFVVSYSMAAHQKKNNLVLAYSKAYTEKMSTDSKFDCPKCLQSLKTAET